MTTNIPSNQDIFPCSIQELRSAIPSECFKPSTLRSLTFFFLDVGAVISLYCAVFTLDQWWFFPIFWFTQGTIFWALFVIGHDCGHGSFSKHKWLNNLIGHLSHTFLLVPFHSWRISHRIHHANTGNIETDESWNPVTQSIYDTMSWPIKLLRFNPVMLLLAFPIYLFLRAPGRKGSHFMPNSGLFSKSEKSPVTVSIFLCCAMLTILLMLTVENGLIFIVKYYFMPYLVFVIWLDLVTFLQHTKDDIPWYRGDDWCFLKGNLSTIDRDYGWFNWIHHNIGTHVVHHLFLKIPHYHLNKATESIIPILGDHYRKSNEPILRSFVHTYLNCHVVANQGSNIYYQRASALEPFLLKKKSPNR